MGEERKQTAVEKWKQYTEKKKQEREEREQREQREQRERRQAECEKMNKLIRSMIIKRPKLVIRQPQQRNEPSVDETDLQLPEFKQTDTSLKSLAIFPLVCAGIVLLIAVISFILDKG